MAILIDQIAEYLRDNEDVVDFAPTVSVEAGEPVMAPNGDWGIAFTDVPANKVGAFRRNGIFLGRKVTPSDIFVAGATIDYDSINKGFIPGSTFKVESASASGDPTVEFFLSADGGGGGGGGGGISTTLGDGQIIVGSSGNVAIKVPMSGTVRIDNVGLTHLVWVSSLSASPENNQTEILVIGDEDVDGVFTWDHVNGNWHRTASCGGGSGTSDSTPQVSGLASSSESFVTTSGTPPDPFSLEIFEWADGVEGQMLSECPLERSTNYYIDSVNGSDANDGLTRDTAWLTAAQVNTHIQSLPAGVNQDIAYNFMAGGVWRGEVANQQSGFPDTDHQALIRTTRRHITIKSDGDGPPPLITRYHEYTGGWTANGGNWERAEARIIRDVKIGGKGFWDSRFYMADPASVADVATVADDTDGSYHSDGVTLTVRFNDSSIDPNTITLEAVEANNETGIDLADHGCRVDGIWCEGYGRTRLAANGGFKQNHPFRASNGANTTTAITNCVGARSGTHVIAYHGNANANGRCVIKDCKAGYAREDSGSTTYNAFSSTGGFEFVLSDCVSIGQLPTYQWYDSFGGKRVNGSSALAHSANGNTVGLFISKGLQCPDVPYGSAAPDVCNDAPNDSGSFSNSRWFSLDTVFRQSRPGGKMAQIAGDFGYRINTEFSATLDDEQLGTLNRGQTQDGTSINSKYVIDTTQSTQTNFALYQAGAGDGVEFHNARITFLVNDPSATVNIPAEDPTQDRHPDARSFNSQMSVIGTPAAINYGAGFPAHATSVINNAFYDSISAVEPGANPVSAVNSLRAEFDYESAGDELYKAGISDATTLSRFLQYDVDRNPRSLTTPSIGPHEGSEVAIDKHTSVPPVISDLSKVSNPISGRLYYLVGTDTSGIFQRNAANDGWIDVSHEFGLEPGLEVVTGPVTALDFSIGSPFKSTTVEGGSTLSLTPPSYPRDAKLVIENVGGGQQQILSGGNSADGTHVDTGYTIVNAGFSLSCWARKDDTGQVRLFNNRTATANGLEFGIGSARTLIVVDNALHGNTGALLNIGQWHHLAFVVNGANVIGYLDGAEVWNITANQTLVSGLGTAKFLGRTAPTNDIKPVSVAKMRFWDGYQLSQPEVAVLATGLDIGQAPTRSYEIDDNSTTIVDSTGGGNATLVNNGSSSWALESGLTFLGDQDAQFGATVDGEPRIPFGKHSYRFSYDGTILVPDSTPLVSGSKEWNDQGAQAGTTTLIMDAQGLCQQQINTTGALSLALTSILEGEFQLWIDNPANHQVDVAADIDGGGQFGPNTSSRIVLELLNNGNVWLVTNAHLTP